MIYLDHNATTPLDPEVFDAMLPYLREHFGNASGYYRLGREARAAIERARTQVADCLGVSPKEIVFTGSGTEADNLALRGVARACREKGRHIITSAIEHHAVLKTCRDLEGEGYEVTCVPVGGDGRIDPEEVRKSITPETVLISIMYANNETGVIQPIEEIAALARQKEILFHTDAIQAAGRIPPENITAQADLVSLSGHKFYGPKGVGVLYVKNGSPVAPILTGGTHEHGLRAGTENTAGIVGFAEAFARAAGACERRAASIERLRDRLEKGIVENIPQVVIPGSKAPRLCNTSTVSFRGIESESILLYLDLKGICASAGSACTTGSPGPSHVLLAMGFSSRQTNGAVRFSLGKDTTEEQIDFTIETLKEIIEKLRSVSSISAC